MIEFQIRNKNRGREHTDSISQIKILVTMNRSKNGDKAKKNFILF